MVPTFSPKVFVPLPHPQKPARTVPKPSVPIPLLMACIGGGGAPIFTDDKIRESIVDNYDGLCGPPENVIAKGKIRSEDIENGDNCSKIILKT